MIDNLLNKIAITKIPGVGSVLAKNLISYCGSIDAVFHANKRELLKIPGIGEKTAQHILSKTAFAAAKQELSFIEENNIQTYFYLDEAFPDRIKHLSDCPLMLYYKGNASLSANRVIAIVGTRKPSVHGMAFCERLISELKPYDVSIISGLAFGIDITAHRKCVELDIPTIGVLGHGLQQIYPFQHRKVAMEMLQNGGLLSEYTSNTGPEREHFPMRNRIIAGMCDALVVVETAKKGGSMISAYIAAEYNKDVFAVPGRVSDKNTVGCNHLIKTHRALLLESAADIAYIMGWNQSEQSRNIQKELFIELSEEEKIVVDLLQEKDAVAFDRLSYDSNLTNSQLANLLLNLEFKGLVKPLPGKRYVLIS